MNNIIPQHNHNALHHLADIERLQIEADQARQLFNQLRLRRGHRSELQKQQLQDSERLALEAENALSRAQHPIIPQFDQQNKMAIVHNLPLQQNVELHPDKQP